MACKSILRRATPRPCSPGCFTSRFHRQFQAGPISHGGDSIGFVYLVAYPSPRWRHYPKSANKSTSWYWWQSGRSSGWLPPISTETKSDDNTNGEAATNPKHDPLFHNKTTLNIVGTASSDAAHDFDHAAKAASAFQEHHQESILQLIKESSVLNWDTHNLVNNFGPFKAHLEATIYTVPRGNASFNYWPAIISPALNCHAKASRYMDKAFQEYRIKNRRRHIPMSWSDELNEKAVWWDGRGTSEANGSEKMHQEKRPSIFSW